MGLCQEDVIAEAVLVVTETELVARMAMLRALALEGHRVYPATDLVETQQRMEQHTAVVLILGNVARSCERRRWLRQFRANGHDIPVVILDRAWWNKDEDKDEDEDAADDLGLVIVLPSRFTVDDVCDIVRALLDALGTVRIRAAPGG